jgi:hypothetical protein
MEIALLKSKNQFVLKTNPPTHTPFFLFVTYSKNKPTHNRKTTTTTTIASKLALFFQKQNKETNKQTNSLFSSCLQTANSFVLQCFLTLN